MADSKTRGKPSLVWHYETDWPLAGVSLAAEPDLILLRNRLHQLELLDHDGGSRGFWSSPAPLISAQISSDGTAVVALSAAGRVTWLAGSSLESRWSQTSNVEPLSLAIDSTGWYAVVADRAGAMLVFDRDGRLVSEFRSPEPLVRLAFAREADLIVGCSADGFVGAFTLAGELAWQQRAGRPWRDLALCSNGQTALIAHEPFWQRIDSHGAFVDEIRLQRPAAGVAISEPGDVLLMRDESGAVRLLRTDGSVLTEWTAVGTLIDAALDPLARGVWLAYEGGAVERWVVSSSGTTAPGRIARSRPQREPRWRIELPPACAVNERAHLFVTDDPARCVLIDGNDRMWIYRSRSSAAEGRQILLYDDLGSEMLQVAAGQALIALRAAHRIAWYDARDNAMRTVDAFDEEIVACAVGADLVLLSTAGGRLAAHDRRGQLRWSKQLDRAGRPLCVGPRAAWVGFESGEVYQFDLAGAPLRQFVVPGAEPVQLAPAGECLVLAEPQSKSIHGYSLTGQPLWQRVLDMSPRELVGVGRWVVGRDAFGSLVAIDEQGSVQATSVDSRSVDFVDRHDEQGLRRAWSHDQYACLGNFAGQLDWRAACGAEVVAVAAGRASVAAVAGQRLLWFDA